MTSEPRQPDIDRLTREEPFVRQLALALMAQDAEDVVQQTYRRALQKRSDGVRSPRKWLARIARNVTHNIRRDQERRIEREGRAAPHELVPSSAELMEREERRRSLVRAVDALDPPLRTVVLLRYFEGLPPKQIARELGLPVTTVWNRLRRALALLRADLEREYGDTRAWLLPLAPAASVRGQPIPSSTMASAGVTLMSTNTKILTFAGVLAAAVLAVVTSGAGKRDPSVPTPSQDSVCATRLRPDAAVAKEEPIASGPREEAAGAIETVDAPATGALSVRVLYDDQPLADVGVRLFSVGALDPLYDSLLGRTDRDGRTLFASLPPGSHRIWTDRRRMNATFERAQVTTGETTEFEMRLPPGIVIPGVTCAGTVTGTEGYPAARAKVSVGERDTLTWFETRSDDEGEYRLDGLPAGEFTIEARLDDGGTAEAELCGDRGHLEEKCNRRLKPTCFGDRFAVRMSSCWFDGELQAAQAPAK